MTRSLSIPAALLAAALTLGLLTGCAPEGDSTSAPAQPVGSAALADIPQTAALLPDSQPDRTALQQEALDRVGSQIRQATAYVIANPAENESMKTFPYGDGDRTAYRKLNKRQQMIYDRILPMVERFEPFSYTAEQDGYDAMNDLMAAGYALKQDNPFCDCYFVLGDKVEGTDTVALVANYFMPGDPDAVPLTTPGELEALRQEMALFRAQCQAIVDGMPKNLTAYDRYRYLAAVISLRTQYDSDFTGGMQIGTAYGAIQSGLSICQGYARGMQLLCQMADLWCACVDGSVGEDSHAWNMVRLEDGTYYVDVTWSDSFGNTPGDPGWFDYFMITQEQLTLNHQPWDGTVATGGRYILPPFPLS